MIRGTPNNALQATCEAHAPERSVGANAENELDDVMERMTAEDFAKFMDEALGDPIYKRQLRLAALLYIAVALGLPLVVSLSVEPPKAFVGRLVMFLMPIVAMAVLYPAYRSAVMWLGGRAERRLALKRGLVGGAST